MKKRSFFVVFICMLLVASLIFVFTGCGEEQNNQTETGGVLINRP